MLKLVALLGATVFLCLSIGHASAASPTTISFQGKVTNANGTGVSDGTYPFVFNIYTTASGGTTLWTESDSISVVGGIFQVNLGANCSFFTAATCNNNTPINFSTASNLYLGINFNGDGEMTPRVLFQSVPFSFYSANSAEVGGLSVSQLVQLSPTTAQSGSVNVSGSGSFGSLNIGSSSVITSSGVLQNVTASTNILTSGTLGVALGGTGLSSLTTNDLLYASGTTTIGQLAGTSGQVLLANSSGQPIFTNISGNVTISGSGVATIASGAVSNADLANNSITLAAGTGLSTTSSSIALGSSATISLASTGVTAASYGTATTTSGVPYFTVNAQGQLTSAGTATLTNSGLVNSSITVANSNDLTGTGTVSLGSTITLGVSNTPSFSGLITDTASSEALNLSGTPAASTSSFLLQVASGSMTGNSNGTYLGINEPSTGNGSMADFINLQNNGTSEFDISSGGNVTVNGTYNTDTLNSSTLTFGAASASNINGANNQNLTLASQGSGQLNLSSGSGTLGINLGTNTFQRVSAGSNTTFVLNLDDTTSANTLFELEDSGAGVANFDLYGGNLETGSSDTIRLDNAGDLENIGNIGASGEETLSDSGTTALYLSGTPASSTTSSIIQLGSAITGGAAGGTYLGINQASTGSADFLNLQLAGASKLKLTSTGALSVAGSITVTGTGTTALVTSPYINATSGYQANGTAGDTLAACAAGDYVEYQDLSEGINIKGTNTPACAAVGLSDERVKDNIVPISGSNVLSDLEAVNPVTFDYNCSDPYFEENSMACNTEPQAGVIAQQLINIFPNLVNADQPEGYYSVNYQGLSIYTLEGVQQLGQYINSNGNASLQTVTANNITTNNLTVDGALSYSSLNTPTGDFSSSVNTPSITSNAGLSIDSGGDSNISIDSGEPGGTIYIGSNDASDVDISSNGQTTNIGGDLNVDQNTNLDGNVSNNLTNGNSFDITSDLSGNNNVVSIEANPSTTSGTKQGIFIQQSAQNNPNGLTSGITIDNANQSTAIGSAVTITNSGGGGYSKLISAPNFSVDSGGNISSNGAFDITGANGQVVASIDNLGNANFSGNLNLASATLSGGLTTAGLTVSGLSTFEQVATFLASTIFHQNVQFEGHITVAGDTAGYAEIATGQTQVAVSFTTPYTTPPIVTVSDLNGQYQTASVNNVTDQGFDINIPVPSLSNIDFSWIALGANNPQTAVSTPVPTPVTTTNTDSDTTTTNSSTTSSSTPTPSNPSTTTSN